MMEAVAVKRVAVLGAGTIGGSWVSWFLARGMQVTVWDPRSGAADFVLRYVADAWFFWVSELSGLACAILSPEARLIAPDRVDSSPLAR